MKIEQIAFTSQNPEELMENLSKTLGLTGPWSHDVVTARGKVFGKPAFNVAQLHFNYDLGFELEVLKYEAGDNWLEDRREDMGEDNKDLPFLSHMGLHVNGEEMKDWKYKMVRLGYKIAQEVETFSHTNPVIAGKRKYLYVVFDTAKKIGFDLKLIQRIDIK